MKRVCYFVLLLVMFVGCKNASKHENQGETTALDTLKTVWKSQLDAVKEKSIQLLGTSGISLVDYQFVDDINNDEKLTKYKDVLKEEQDLFLYYDASLNQLKVLTKREMQGVGPAQAQLSFDKMNEYIDENIHEGMKVIRLTWDNNGTSINTLCIVSDLEGLVYDCFLSNILLFNVEGKTVERVESVL